MNISPTDLYDEYTAAVAAWPHIAEAERAYDLPRMLLFAVGSRETNLTDETGDGGHGRGVFQLDDRSHVIPIPFPVDKQADIAAAMLRALIDHFAGSLTPAVAAYNAGVGGVERVTAGGLPADMATTGQDYAADVLDRMGFLDRTFPDATPEDDMPKPTDKVRALKNPNGTGFYELQADGGIITNGGATFPDGMPPYWVLRSDGSIYHFPYSPPGMEPIMNYVGLAPSDKQGSGWMTDFGWE